MKIFYSASISRSKNLLPISKDLITYIKSFNHEVLTEELVDPLYVSQADRTKKPNGEDVYQTALKKLAEADVLITECTVPSFGAAFWIDRCSQMNKPLLSLHYGLDYSNATPMLQGDKDRINLQMYTEDNAKDVIKNFFTSLEEKRTKRAH
jgi:hypothetical protein